jgi:hypothetical protein
MWFKSTTDFGGGRPDRRRPIKDLNGDETRNPANGLVIGPDLVNGASGDAAMVVVDWLDYLRRSEFAEA